MRTLQEKYNALLENKYSVAQFLRTARMELPQYVTPLNDYSSTVKILKNKGIIA